MKRGILISCFRLSSAINQLFRRNHVCTEKTLRCLEDRKSPGYQHHRLGKDIRICCATHLYEILRDVTVVLEEANITYFITFGTLLGAVRHKGFIPWDTDVDIGILRQDSKKAHKILKLKLGQKYFISEDFPNMTRINFSRTNTLHCDLEIWEEREERVIFDSPSGNYYEFAKADVLPAKPYKIYDLTVMGPATDNFLTGSYGDDYMEIGYKQWKANDKGHAIADFASAPLDKSLLRMKERYDEK
ncbi:MAG: LicD family protein [Bacteroidales bacterium]|nr:LicD family protein [Bacteroidales bacterium]